MRKILILLPILGMILLGSCNAFAGDEGDGIQFFEGSWAQALEKSKKEHKPIFLDIYASWCGPCKMLKKKTFTSKKVGEYFNSHFINVSIDGEKGDGPQLANQFQLRAYPTLIVLNTEGKVKMYEMGFYEPKELLDMVKGVVGE